MNTKPRRQSRRGSSMPQPHHHDQRRRRPHPERRSTGPCARRRWPPRRPLRGRSTSRAPGPLRPTRALRLPATGPGRPTGSTSSRRAGPPATAACRPPRPRWDPWAPSAGGPPPSRFAAQSVWRFGAGGAGVGVGHRGGRCGDDQLPARPVRSARRVHLRLPANWPWAADWLDLFTAALGPPTATAA